jgi:tetratricopeptide (TPR) repeat protein
LKKKMQHNIFTTMRSLKIMDGCKGSQVYAVHHPSSGGGSSGIGEKLLQQLHDHIKSQTFRSKSVRNFQSPNQTPSEVVAEGSLLPYGLPMTDLLEPKIEPVLRPVDFVERLAELHNKIENCLEVDRSEVYLEHCSVFRGLSDAKLFRRSLRSARQHAVDVHSKVVLASWLRYERREDEMIGSSSMNCCGRNIECPKATLVANGYDPELVYDRCCCQRDREGEDGDEEDSMTLVVDDQECSTSDEDDGGGDMSFCIGDDEIRCHRFNMASLSRPFKTMLYGGFIESRREKINFSKNEISVEAMRAAEVFSRTKSLSTIEPNVVLELLSLANRFCCDEMKCACDAHLALLVCDMEDASLLIEYGLEETAYLLVAACLQVFLRELPVSMECSSFVKLFCSPEGRDRLATAGHASFVLYHFLSQVAMEEEMRSNTTVMLLERLVECAKDGWEKQLAYHQLGVVMFERKEYKDAQHWFEAAVEAGHVYSLVGVARAKYKRGHTYSAYKLMNSLIDDYKPVGWMYQERSLYCIGKEKMMDLISATELDPTLPFPYKFRAVSLLEENRIGPAIAEINKILGFRVSPDCLELRAWFLIAMEDYEGALRDVRAILTLDPNYMMFYGNMHGNHLVELLGPVVQQYNQADCWMQLYDRWSSVDDIGSLAVVHQMLENDPGKSLLRFRQSLLLLR